MKIKILLLLLLCYSFSFGQTIFDNPLTFLSGIQTSPYTTSQTVDANITVSGISRGSGINGSAAQNRYSANSWSTTTLDVNDYFEFTLTPNSGYKIDFTSFVYTSQVSSGAPSHAFRSSLDGFTANIGTPTTTGTTISLTSSTYQNISSPITFRFYSYGLAATTTTFSINDFIFNGSVSVSCAFPTTQATAYSATSITASSATVNWVRGNGTNIMVVARAASAVNADPVYSNSYTANAAYGLGTEVGTGNYVVYNGTGTSVNLTGLTSGTAYYLAVYEYNLGTLCYNTTELTGTFSTPVVLPNVVLSDNGTQIAAGNVAQNSTDNVISSFKITVSGNTATLTKADFSLLGNYLAADIVASGFKLWYSAANDFTTATSIRSLSSGSTGTGETLSFSSLSQSIPIGQGYFWITASIAATAVVNRTIQVAAISNPTFLTYTATASNTGSITAAGIQTISPTAPSVPATFTKGCTGNTSQVLNWTAPATGTFDGYLLVVREANAPHAVTSILTTTPQNSDYSLAPTYGSTAVLSRILYSGTATTATVTGLAAGISYTFAIYTYKISTLPNAVYSVAKTTTQVIGLPNVSSANASAGNASATLTWVNPNAACYDQILVVATTTSGITFTPTGNGSSYSANAVYASPNQVVYGSSGNLVNVSGLTNGVTYYFEIFVRNGTQWSSGVEVAVTPSPIVPTVLKTGDLVLIAYTNTTASSADDSIRLLSLVDINPGTKFLWANATYETGGNPAANVRTDKWFECTAAPTGNVPFLEFTYTGATVIPAASVFCFRTASSGTGSTISVSFPVSGSTSSFTIVGKSANGSTLLTHGAVNVSTSNPDAMFLMQGNFNYGASGSTFVGRVLSAVQDGGLWYDLPDDLSAISGSNLRKSRKHPQLLCASIQANVTPNNYSFLYNTSVSSNVTGNNRPDLLVKILNYTTNWVSGFGTCPSPSPFSITASDPFNKWIGNLSTNWFDCNNWALRSIPDELTDVTIFASATNDAIIDYTSPYSDGYSDIAKCRNLTISGKKVQLEANSLNKLIVYGNVLIDGTGVLDMDDNSNATADGDLSVYGNWTNNASTSAFLEGNGTVQLIGSLPQIINNNVHTNPEEFYNVILDNDLDTSISNNLIVTSNLEIKTNKLVSIASNNLIRVNNKLTLNGNLTIENSGQLIQVNESDSNDGDYGDTVNQKFSVKRVATINQFDYVYWSSPVTGFDISSILNGPRYYWNTLFANSNATFGNWNVATGAMVSGKGYIIRVPNSAPARPTPPTQLLTQFFGKPNNGQFTFAITRENLVASIDDNWNLLGNPYPSTLDAEEFLVENQAKIVGTVWVWTHGQAPTNVADPFYYDFQNNYYSSDYIKYNKLGSSDPNSFNGKIASGQGFMVNMLETATPPSTVAFTNNMRSADVTNAAYDNSFFFKNSTIKNAVSTTAVEEKDRIWLDVLSIASGKTDRMLLGYSTNSTLGKDNLYDSFFVPRNEVALYSLIDNDPFIIQGRPLPFNNNDLVPLGLKVVVAGNYKIAINQVDGLFANTTQDIFLEDKLLNIIHDLRQSTYTFTAAVGVFNDRFVLRYTNSTLATPSYDLDSKVAVAVKNKIISIQSLSEIIKSVTVFDLLGRKIAVQEAVNSNETSIENITATNQTIILKIQLQNGITVTRKVIL